MMLFKGNIKRLESNDPVNGNTLRKLIEKNYVLIQSKWAKWMAKKTAALSARQLLIVWGAFLIISAAYSMYLIVVSFSGNATNTLTGIPVAKRVKPVLVNDGIMRKNNPITKTEYVRIHRFCIYMDSLTDTPAGKKVHDSIVNRHPGLLDSIAIIENYYQSNLKNQ